MRPLRVGLDASLLATPTPSGVERAIRSTLAALAEAGPRFAFHVYGPASSVEGSPAGFHVHPAPPRRWGRSTRILWQQVVLPGLVGRDRLDVFHAPAYVCPLAAPCPVVLTVYDTIALDRPELCKRANALHYRLLMPPSVRRAAEIVVPTRHVRDRLTRRFHLPVERVSVIPPPLLDLGASRAEGKPLPRLPERFLLYVGNIEPKKGVATLVRAFAQLRREGLPHRLVLAGRWAWRCDDVRRVIEAEGVGDAVVSLGYVPDADLPALYRRAEALVAPSLEEGLGLPPIEALAFGAPVVASDIPPFRETLGAAAVFFPVGRPAALAEAIRGVLGGEARQENGATASGVLERFRRMDLAALLRVYERAARARRL